MDLEVKRHNLEQIIRPLGRVLVCFSGGADSSLLLFLCHRLLGADNVTAFTVVSRASLDEEVAFCRTFAAHLKVPLIIGTTDVLAIPEIAGGDPRRCYFCKRNIFVLARKEAHKRGIGVIVEGSNLDDLDDIRPGFAAIEEFAIRSPLLEAKLTKEDVRALSRRLTLPTWDKSPTTCLLTRFPYQETVTPEALQRVKQCEGFLHAEGFSLCRVRSHLDTARIEVPAEDIPRFADQQLRWRLLEYFTEAGFVFVTLDLAGYRQGSMNRKPSPAMDGEP